MQDLVAGRYRLPWEDEVVHIDGTATAFPKPTRRYGETAREGRGIDMPTVAANPYPWPYNGDWRPDNTALIIIDMQTDFCGEGGYVDTHGLRPLADARADRADQGAARGDARQGLSRHPHPRGPSARPRRPARQQALALAPDRRRHRRSPAPAARSWCAASRAGTSSTNSRRCPASRSSTSPARARSARPISN